MSLETFNDFNKEIFFDASLPKDVFSPLADAPTQHISPAELTETLAHKFKANKSSGLSKMPLELLRHLGPTGIACVASFLNASAIDQLAPALWRTTKVTPLYKGKGDAMLPENYRSIAIPPPFAKLLMAVVNQRLTATAVDMGLHAPTQAGFRAHHSTTEQALILQTLI
jgi:hypothetical protein